MVVELESAKRLNALIAKANAATGGDDATVTDAVDTLIAGFGQGGGDENLLDARIEGTLTQLESNATSIVERAFENYTPLVSAKFPNAETVNARAFFNCKNLKTLELPSATWVKSSIIGGTALTKLVLPSVTKCDASALGYCNYLKMIDLPSLTSVNSTTFLDDKSLIAVILRRESVVPTVGANNFNGCYHFLGTVNATYNPDGLTDGYVYVPSSVLDAYKNSTNWSVYADRFRALEDYTVDGTITGDLDESKI